MKGKVILAIGVSLLFSGCVTSFVKEPIATFHHGHHFSLLVSVDDVMFVQHMTRKKDITLEEYNKLKKIYKNATTITTPHHYDNPYIERKLRYYKPFYNRYMTEKEAEKMIKNFERGDFKGYDQLVEKLKHYRFNNLLAKVQQAYEKSLKKRQKDALKQFNVLKLKIVVWGMLFDPVEIRRVTMLLNDVKLQDVAKQLQKIYVSSLLNNKEKIAYIPSRQKYISYLYEIGREDVVKKLEETVRKRREEERRKELGIVDGMQYCSLEDEKKEMVKKDSFGNVTRKKVKYLEYIIRTHFYPNIDKQKTKREVMKFWAEIIFMNKKKLKFDREEYIFLTGYLPQFVHFNKLPSQINFNYLNVLNKKTKISGTYSLMNFARKLFYYFDGNGWETTRDRMLAMQAFFAKNGEIVFPIGYTCQNFKSAGFIERVIEEILDSMNRKDPKAYKVAAYILNDRYTALDRYLLSDPSVKKLFLIGRKHYLMLEGKK